MIPATIADNVGDNVGDVAGMGADLYESYAGSILATAALGVAAVGVAGASWRGGLSLIDMQLRYLAAPLSLAGIGVFLSILGIYLVRTREGASMAELMGSLNRSINISSLGIMILGFPIVYLLGLPNWLQVGIAITVGLIVGIIIGKNHRFRIFCISLVCSCT